MKVKDTFSSKAIRVYNVTLVKDEVVARNPEERGTMLMLLKLQARKQQSILSLTTVEPLSTSGKRQ